MTKIRKFVREFYDKNKKIRVVDFMTKIRKFVREFYDKKIIHLIMDMKRLIESYCPSSFNEDQLSDWKNPICSFKIRKTLQRRFTKEISTLYGTSAFVEFDNEDDFDNIYAYVYAT